jgi:DeoR family transcriptional regulator, fructose operon transcriptional repressor
VYAEERQQAIADLVTRNHRVSVSAAAETFGVTTETVRRDLALLERQGLVHRVHGGAVPAGTLTTVEPGLPERDLAATDQKNRIARAALDLLPASGGSLLLDAGTTTQRLAAILPRESMFTVVTNAATIVTTLVSGAQPPGVDVRLLGGRIRSASLAGVGPQTLEALAQIRVDVAFIGTNGISLVHGLSTPDHDEAAVKSAMVTAGRRVVVLTDSRKFGRESLVRFARLDQIDAVVTDDGISDDDAQALEALDIDVVIA